MCDAQYMQRSLECAQSLWRQVPAVPSPLLVQRPVVPARPLHAREGTHNAPGLADVASLAPPPCPCPADRERERELVGLDLGHRVEGETAAREPELGGRLQMKVGWGGTAARGRSAWAGSQCGLVEQAGGGERGVTGLIRVGGQPGQGRRRGLCAATASRGGTGVSGAGAPVLPQLRW